MSGYYTPEEIQEAIERATLTINERSSQTDTYQRGYNDCLALLIEYDLELRGDKSMAGSYIDFSWKTTKEFFIKLLRSGKSLDEFSKVCNYELIPSKRPLLGDIAFEQGAMINDGSFWVSTNENNSGVCQLRQSMFLERHLHLLARPIRS